MPSVMPIMSAVCLRGYQSVTAASVAIWKVSAPMPKRSRPAAIATKLGLAAVRTAPRKHTAEVQVIIFPAPNRSTRIPPVSTRTTLGRL